MQLIECVREIVEREFFQRCGATLKSLSFRNARFNHTYSDLGPAVSHCTALTEVTFIGDEFLSAIRALPTSVHRVTLGDLPRNCGEVFQAVATYLPGLTELHITSKRCAEIGLLDIAKGCPLLKVLDFGGACGMSPLSLYLWRELRPNVIITQRVVTGREWQKEAANVYLDSLPPPPHFFTFPFLGIDEEEEEVQA